MEMRRILTAVAVFAPLVSAAQAVLEEHDTTILYHRSRIMDGREVIRWPFDPKPKPLTVCTIPIKMKVGTYVEIRWPAKIIEADIVPVSYIVVVEEDIHRKIVLRQVPCSDIGRDSNDWPCYLDCIKFRVRANFQVKLETELIKTSSVIDEWEAFFDGTNIIGGSGRYKTVKVCVKAWKAKLYNSPAGERDVGTLVITAKPDI
jgi:hypothetical protein